MHYVLDLNKNFVEAYSKEEVLAVIAQAIENGSLKDITAEAAFISKVKCCVSGASYNLAFVTQAKLNELEANGQKQENTYYFVIDDTKYSSINAMIEEISTRLTDIETALNQLNTTLKSDIKKNAQDIKILQNRHFSRVWSGSATTVNDDDIVGYLDSGGICYFNVTVMAVHDNGNVYYQSVQVPAMLNGSASGWFYQEMESHYEILITSHGIEIEYSGALYKEWYIVSIDYIGTYLSK